MWKASLLFVALLSVPGLAQVEPPAAVPAELTSPAPATQPAAPAETQPAIAPSHITAVTVYQGNALVTREVDVRGEC